MLNGSRHSDPIKVRSRRWTLLCWITLCSLIFLLLILFPFDLIKKRKESLSMNLFRYRSSLIQCGQSVIEDRHSSQYIADLLKLFEQNDLQPFIEQMNDERKRMDFIHWLETLLNQCSILKDYSIDEQNKPRLIRKIFSFLRYEFFYVLGLFTNHH